MIHGTRSQQGFAIIAALFLLIIVGVLAGLAIRISGQQQHSTDLDLLGARAWAAAQSGLSHGLTRANGGACGFDSTFAFPAAMTSLNGFSVRVRCTQTLHQVSGVNYFVRDVTAMASRGSYGAPDFVQRELTRRISSLP